MPQPRPSHVLLALLAAAGTSLVGAAVAAALGMGGLAVLLASLAAMEGAAAVVWGLVCKRWPTSRKDGA